MKSGSGGVRGCKGGGTPPSPTVVGRSNTSLGHAVRGARRKRKRGGAATHLTGSWLQETSTDHHEPAWIREGVLLSFARACAARLCSLHRPPPGLFLLSSSLFTFVAKCLIHECPGLPHSGPIDIAIHTAGRLPSGLHPALCTHLRGHFGDFATLHRHPTEELWYLSPHMEPGSGN